jgi:ABC-type sugar transport system ATPase subunit
MNKAPSLISMKHITKHFPGVLALSNVTLDVWAGEIHAVCGENGAGKSTLMKILGGVDTDYEGQLLLRGKPVRFAGTWEAERAGVSLIHQELHLVDQLSVAANIFMGREIRTSFRLLDNEAMERVSARLLDELQCTIDPREIVGQLRIGDRQLVEIAKALSLENEILIMDEPTSALSQVEADRLFGVIRGLRERGVTILYISHKMEEIFRLSDRISVLRDGQMVATLRQSETNARQITHLMVGREIESRSFDTSRQTGDVVLSVENLSLPSPGHARRWRLDKITFSLRHGEILGVAGLLGAGRTELLECLSGSSPETPLGRIVLAGRGVRFEHPAEALEAGVALLTEDRGQLGILPHMTVGQNITIATLHRMASMGIVRPNEEARAAGESVKKLAIKATSLDEGILSLSGGNQQKTILARCLLASPNVLLLDDPTRGVDVGAKAELYGLIEALCHQGLSILMTSSELPELLKLCHRILVLCEGRLTAEFRREEATEQKLMEAATRFSPKKMATDFTD